MRSPTTLHLPALIMWNHYYDMYPLAARQALEKKHRRSRDAGGGPTGDKIKRTTRAFRRKAHHHFMVVKCSGLQPGTNYHFRIAGINSKGQARAAAVYMNIVCLVAVSSPAMVFIKFMYVVWCCFRWGRSTCYPCPSASASAPHNTVDNLSQHTRKWCRMPCA